MTKSTRRSLLLTDIFIGIRMTSVARRSILVMEFSGLGLRRLLVPTVSLSSLVLLQLECVNLELNKLVPSIKP